ncbi:hypothetical protein HG531_010201 [Fusarium graminearum]|nr:hypothetical protein HG531_010201 [Fusarium graminearum]
MTPVSPWLMGMADFITRPDHIPRYELRAGAPRALLLRDLNLRTFNDDANLRAASMPELTPPDVTTRRPPSRMAARRTIDSRRVLESLNDMLPFLGVNYNVPGCRRATSLTSIGLAADVWALVLPEIESQVVDNITSVLYHIVGDQGEGLKLFGDNLLGVTTDDDEDIKVLKTVVCLLVGDLGANDDTLVRDDLGFGTDDGDLKGLAVCRKGILEVVTCRSKDLERAGKVQKIELFVNSEENVNGLLVSDGRGLLCTHLGGIVGGLEEGLI